MRYALVISLKALPQTGLQAMRGAATPQDLGSVHQLPENADFSGMAAELERFLKRGGTISGRPLVLSATHWRRSPTFDLPALSPLADIVLAMGVTICVATEEHPLSWPVDASGHGVLRPDGGSGKVYWIAVVID